MSKRFLCTACGKCCYGQLPLTWKDALANVGRFPIGIVWSPVSEGSKDFKLVGELGVTIPVVGQRKLAALIVPTSFIPSTFPCPALRSDNLCGIHAMKPSRCKTMPFYPYREERFQGELLTPRQEWACDTSEVAPIVFEENKIVLREDFDQERYELIEQSPLIRKYANYMLKYSHNLLQSLLIASTSKNSGQVITSLSSFLTATKLVETKAIAQQQLPVLNDFAEKTLGIPELVDFHKNYTGWAKEMAYLAKV